MLTETLDTGINERELPLISNTGRLEVDDPSSEGWLVFAGIILMLAGAMRSFDAILAWSYNGAVPSHLKAPYSAKP